MRAGAPHDASIFEGMEPNIRGWFAQSRLHYTEYTLSDIMLIGSGVPRS